MKPFRMVLIPTLSFGEFIKAAAAPMIHSAADEQALVVPGTVATFIKETL
jgi:hypothetical protein